MDSPARRLFSHRQARHSFRLVLQEGSYGCWEPVRLHPVVLAVELRRLVTGLNKRISYCVGVSPHESGIISRPRGCPRGSRWLNAYVFSDLFVHVEELAKVEDLFLKPALPYYP